MKPAAFVICETAPRWSGYFRQVLPLRKKLRQSRIHLREVRSLVQAAGLLKELPQSLLAVEVSAENVVAVHCQLLTWRSTFPLARFFVLAGQDLAANLLLDWEPFLREAGAVAVGTSPLAVRLLGKLAVRHLAGVKSQEIPWQDEMWERLPWGGMSLLVRKQQ